MAPPKDHPPLGSHLSIAGSMVSALDEALRLGMDCVQVFTKNQRQWAVKEMPAEERDEWVRRCTELDWHATSAVPRVVSHNSYLINLASPDPEIRRKSIDLQRVEMERCEMLSIRYLVAHPGAHLTGERKPGEPNDLSGAINAAERAGLDRIVSALDELHAALPGYRVITCLETTVGSGTNLGYAFEHLAYVRGAVRESDRVGFCLDTCHVTAAGYDMTSEEKADGVMRHFDAICGLSNLYAVHLNDSEGAVGSRKDRHAHIGHGTCGASCFRAVLNHPQLRRVPMVLETEKEDDDRGEPWDLINLKALKALMRR